MSIVDDIRLKLVRAEEHLDHFKAVVFGQKGPIYAPHSVGVHYEPLRHNISVTSRALEPEQRRGWGILIGDVIHQTRSSLDHLVYALATRSARQLTEKEARSLSFPICVKATDFAADWRVSQGFFEGILGSKELTHIEAAQPYLRGRSELWILKGLDDIDKHRSVLVLDNRVQVKGTAYSEDGAMSHQFRVVKDPTPPETQVFRLGWPHPLQPAAVSVDDISRQIVFAETNGLCDGAFVFPLMRDIIAETLQVLIDFDEAHFFGF